MLRYLSVRYDLTEYKELKQKFDTGSFLIPALSKLFSSNLDNKSEVKFVQVAVVLTAQKREDYKIFGNQIDLYSYCDFETLFNGSLNTDVRKEYIIGLMRNSLYRNHLLLGMQNQDITNAYDRCLQDKLVYERFYKRKLFRSPSHQYYFGLLMIHDITYYEIWEVWFNNKREEIARRIGYRDKSDLYYIASAKWEDSENFCYKFDGVKKTFCCSIDDITSGKASEANTYSELYT